MGFFKPTGLTWKYFINILNNDSLQIDTKGVDQEAARKRIIEIDKKLLNLISKKFKLEPPEGFKLYERDPTKGLGVYRFKFKIKQNTPSRKAYCREKFFKLAKLYKKNPTYDNRKIIEIRGKEYLSKNYITKDEIIEAITHHSNIS